MRWREREKEQDRNPCGGGGTQCLLGGGWKLLLSTISNVLPLLLLTFCFCFPLCMDPPKKSQTKGGMFQCGQYSTLVGETVELSLSLCPPHHDHYNHWIKTHVHWCTWDYSHIANSTLGIYRVKTCGISNSWNFKKLIATLHFVVLYLTKSGGFFDETLKILKVSICQLPHSRYQLNFSSHSDLLGLQHNIIHFLSVRQWEIDFAFKSPGRIFFHKRTSNKNWALGLTTLVFKACQDQEGANSSAIHLR